MATLHELTQEFLELDRILESLEGEEIPAELEDAVDEILTQKSENQEQLHKKINGYVALIKHCEMFANDAEAEAKRMQQRAESERKKAEYLKHRLQQFFELTGLDKVKTTKFTVGVRKASQAPLIVKVDAEKLPEKFQKVTVTANKVAIKEAIKAGEDVSEIAEYGDKSSYLSIR
jgi:hypothetical protein